MPLTSCPAWLRTLAAGCLLNLPSLAAAHFLELIPSRDILTPQSGARLQLSLAFSHPMEGGPVMPLGKPVRFGVFGPEGDSDLLATLEPLELHGGRSYRADYQVRRPGDHCFYVVPAPYWEPAEGVMIIHYAKVVVDAFGAGEGWDRELGLPVEIIPLARPYGLWTGNLFRGLVKRDGHPVPFAEVEVAWRNDGTLDAPADAYATQVVKTDANGVFAYAMPRSGWWGFAALVEGGEPMANPEGVRVPVELGGLIWVYTRDMR